MADAGLFIGWGETVRGRERKALDVFNEAVSYYGRLQQESRIESFEVALLQPHGGDLGGFALLRGTEDQVAAVRADDEFERITVRANLVVDRVGVVSAVLGGGLGDAIQRYQEQVEDLT